MVQISEADRATAQRVIRRHLWTTARVAGPFTHLQMLKGYSLESVPRAEVEAAACEAAALGRAYGRALRGAK